MASPVLIPPGLRLVRPGADRLEPYLRMIEDAVGAGEDGHGFLLTVTSIVRREPATYLRRLAEMEAEIDLPEGWVPMSTRWLIDAGEEVVGETRLRHRLTPALEVEGGHIGYFIGRSARGRGYGNAILAMGLGELSMLGIKRVLVTCDEDNLQSRRVIQRNGGVFERFAISPRSGKKVMGFWIDNGAR